MHTSVLIRPRIEWYGFPEIVGPLTHRAWVLQERLLSPRILHFGGQQVMWQCQTRSLAEGFCDSDPVPQEQIPGAIESLLRTEFHTVTKIESIMEGNTSIDKMRDERYESILPGPDAMAKSVYRVQDSIYGQWYQVVAMYAKLQLTKQTDRLPAIAGIARQVQLRTGDTYLCGFWKSDIVRGLHWCYGPPSVMIRPATPRAPSWSWASLDLTADESLVPPSTDFHLLATYASQHIPYEHEVSLVSFESSLIDHGCLGSSAGAVTLLGLWRIAMISTSMVVPPGRFNLSYPTPLVLKGQAPSICAAARLDVDRNHLDDAEIGCLQLGKFQYIGPKYPSEAFVAALLLQRVSQANNASPRFVRIGLAVLFNDCDPVNGWDERAVEVV